ncbi:MAG: zf-HC2 domain-containing protein [Gammaproteobacteria bacterium]|nr:zf-HC2 domain-containing protein [Gammaproteobacteria bacterium]
MLKCRQVNEKASALLDDALSHREYWALQMHLLLCRNCRRYLSQLQATVGVVKALGNRSAESPEHELQAAALAQRLQFFVER